MSNPKSPPARVGKALSSILSSTRVASESTSTEAAEIPPAATSGPTLQTPLASRSTPAERLDVEPVTKAPPAETVLVIDETEQPLISAPGPARHLTLDSRQELATEVAAATASAEEKGSARKRETFLVSAELADEMRDAIVHLQGPPMFLNLAGFGEEAIRAYLARLKAEHTGGQPFPKRPHAVRQGRPLR